MKAPIRQIQKYRNQPYLCYSRILTGITHWQCKFTYNNKQKTGQLSKLQPEQIERRQQVAFLQ